MDGDLRRLKDQNIRDGGLSLQSYKTGLPNSTQISTLLEITYVATGRWLSHSVIQAQTTKSSLLGVCQSCLVKALWSALSGDCGCSDLEMVSFAQSMMSSSTGQRVDGPGVWISVVRLNVFVVLLPLWLVAGKAKWGTLRSDFTSLV